MLTRHSRPAAAVAVVLLAGGLSGFSAAVRDRPPSMEMPSGRVVLVGVAKGDPTGGAGERRVVVDPAHILLGDTWVPWEGPHLLVTGAVNGVAAGEPVAVDGRLQPASFRTRRGWVGGVVEVDRFDRLGESANPLFRLGNRLRRRVLGGLADVSATPQGALVSGFLIGDVSGLPDSDAEALRAAGLNHFVAVSGSNVALFLTAWWIVSGPLAWSPRRRALAGLAGLAVFVVVTRWEPSVLRAAVMAAMVLGGRLVGRVVSPWAALSWAVTALVLIDGGLVAEIGFQLSVAATAGILVGIRLWRERKPRWIWVTLGATLSAQTAVAPILLIHFGAIPLLAPLTNLVAAPLVTLATTLGGIGALLGADRVVGLAVGVAAIVLRIARGTADLPQLGAAQSALCLGLGLLASAVRPLRPVVTAVAVMAVAVAVAPAGLPAGPTIAFLDVGQGDATLLRGPSGEVILIDGGPDPAVLRAHLRKAGVRHIDLMIVSHRHADHTTGLVGLHVPVTRVWHPPQLGEGSPLDDLVAEQGARGAEVGVPSVGTVAEVGSFTVEVLAPLRKYASPNDGSLVVRVTASGVDVLFSGDIEAIAQADLGPLRADVLKVPHQGSATSDLDWITASAPAIAVISVGVNDFGHPSPQVIAAFEEAGVVVYRTDRDGTITLRLDKLAAARAPLPSHG
ncbi:MAG: ComEC/Rec2 family competence protein [Actinomycetota bacterium]